MKKKLFSSVLILLVSLALITSSFASITPLWDNIGDCDVTLAFNGRTAECSVDIGGNPGTSRIVATVELQVKNSSGNYVRSASWSTQTVYGTDFSFYEYAYNRPAGEYRLIVNATVYNANGVGESVYREDYATCYG